MSQEPLEYLKSLLFMDLRNPIPNRIPWIEPILYGIETTHPEDLAEAVNLVKDAVQREAELSILVDHRPTKRGLLALATGVGKSKIPINHLMTYYKPEELVKGDIMIVTPTQLLRDEGWKDEFDKWGAGAYYEKAERICYASLAKLKDKHVKVFIADEFHNTTFNNALAYYNITCNYFFALSATTPKEGTPKRKLMNELGIHVTYQVTIDQAVQLRLISPYELTIVHVPLNAVDATVKAGSKTNPFFQTELAAYTYLSKKVGDALHSREPNIRAGHTRWVNTRALFLGSLESITSAAHQIINLIPEGKQTLVFANTIEQAIRLSPNRYFTKPSKSKKDTPEQIAYKEWVLQNYQGEAGFTAFKNKEVQLLSCIEKLNEGHNIPGIQYSLSTSIDSNDKNLLQRMGRSLRYVPGHVGKFFILVPAETVALNWVNSSIAELDPRRIRTVTLQQILSGQIQI